MIGAASSQGNYLTQAASASAAGQIGAANAFGNALQTAGEHAAKLSSNKWHVRQHHGRQYDEGRRREQHLGRLAMFSSVPYTTPPLPASLASAPLYDGTGRHIGERLPPIMVDGELTPAWFAQTVLRPHARSLQCDAEGASALPGVHGAAGYEAGRLYTARPLGQFLAG